MTKADHISFGKEYYDAIWPTQGVHRHDYVGEWLNRIKAEYPDVKSVLDVGCGCGNLVKKLRGAGYDAWGTEISQYALDNTCAPGFVVYGDVRNLPFKDNRFDLVFSQGLWAHISEKDIEKARDECFRVGKKQLHNIDYVQPDIPTKLETIRDEAWWNEKLARPKVLVACPVHKVKEYSFQKYIDNIKQLEYPNYDLLCVENTPTSDFYNRYKDKIPMIRLESSLEPGFESMNQCVTEIQKVFLEGNYSNWFSTATDVIYTPDILDLLMKFKDYDWVCHAFKSRDNNKDYQTGISCSLLSRRIIEAVDFKKANQDAYDYYLWSEVKPRLGEFTSIELWGVKDIKHYE